MVRKRPMQEAIRKGTPRCPAPQAPKFWELAHASRRHRASDASFLAGSPVGANAARPTRPTAQRQMFCSLRPPAGVIDGQLVVDPVQRAVSPQPGGKAVEKVVRFHGVGRLKTGSQKGRGSSENPGEDGCASGLARIFRTPSRGQDRPRIIDRRGGRRLPDMRAKSQTALFELAGEKRRRQRAYLASDSWSRGIVRSFIFFGGGLAISPDVLDAETAEICLEQIVDAQRSEV